MAKRVIVFEFRRSKTPIERKCRGITRTDENGVTSIFINLKQSHYDQVETYFHELAHAVFHWTGHQFTDAQQEKVAKRVGKLAARCFPKGK